MLVPLPVCNYSAPSVYQQVFTAPDSSPALSPAARRGLGGFFGRFRDVSDTSPKDKALGTANPSRRLAKALVKNADNGYELRSAARAGGAQGLVCLQQFAVALGLGFIFFFRKPSFFNSFSVSLATLQQLGTTGS